MPKLTLLEIVQDILSDMNSDEVNSINDTLESVQVAGMVKATYYELINSRLWPSHTELIQLSASTDIDNPTKLTPAESVNSINWIKYDVRKTAGDDINFKTIGYKDPIDFLELLYTRKSTEANIKTVSITNNAKLLIRTDKEPEWWTSFDDNVIYFDSYDSSIDTTIQTSKVQAEADVEPSFTLADTFIPDLPVKAFPYFLAEAKSNCFEKIKQAPSAKEEQKSRRQRTYLARNKWRTNGGIRYPDYGRK